ncbi:phosphodiesterase [Hugonella massiliensis]|uniref:phosphodiesterase n=1 Tax=Hugonella massiliensis TaxID=1720315 RepID=UPI00073EB164|nr:phosphodiesterase [Hugonella massiliensis]
MKLVIASDIHGSAYWCGKLMDEIEREAPDTVVLLGDLLYHGPRNDLPRGYAPKQVLAMLNTLADHVVAVRGNCDAEVDQMVLDFPMMADYAVIADGGFQMLCTHGHLPSPDRVPAPPQGGALLYGHTHVKMNEPLDVRMPDGSVVPTVRMLNPGSVSIPKDGSNSFAVYQDGEFELRNL